MITRIAGTLVSVDARGGVVQPEGTGLAYEVLLPAYLADRLAAEVGRRVILHTLEYLEAQGQGTSFVPRLIGFESRDDRRFFEVFTTVKGMGNKRALRALAVPPGEVAAMVVSKDAKGLQRLPEIGKRVAETVIVELSGKLDGFVTADALERRAGSLAEPSIGISPAAAEAVRALIALGET
ncbi:MAG TPA: helix-hairpin-helix domain-containing protein, partial [Phycisphaerales bacterium]|nr:helix-hairpin-helix domain-containing protein [Phycisphaerales bacterium]